MLLRSCCTRCDRTSSGSLRRRSWLSGHATSMWNSSSTIGSKNVRCLMSSTSGTYTLHLWAKVPPCGVYFGVSIASGWELSLSQRKLYRTLTSLS